MFCPVHIMSLIIKALWMVHVSRADLVTGELEQLLHMALRSEPESETRERVKGIVAASHETQAVSALLAVRQDPDPRLTVFTCKICYFR